jgi:hypothetical protein
MAPFKASAVERRLTVAFALVTVGTLINWAVGRQLYPLYYYVISGALALVTAMVAVLGVVLLRRARGGERAAADGGKAIN